VKLEEILADWKTDAVIDSTDISGGIIRTPMLHAKYLDYYVFFKAKLSATEKTMSKMKYLKRRYYRGEMDKTELAHHGWDPYQGLKPSGSELNQLFDMDTDIAEIQEKLEYYDTGIKSMEYIMKQIHGRDYTLKTLFEYNKYLGG
jgi:hypothetical protein